MKQTSVVTKAPGFRRKTLLGALAFLLSSTFLGLAAQSPAGGRPPSEAQAPSRQQEPQTPPPYRMAVRVDLVEVEATVSDAQGNFVSELKRENFRVLDDGVPQPLTHFASVEAPARVLVLVETSPAVYLIHQQHLQAAYALLDGLAADDQVALATYDQSARLVLSFTPDKRMLAEALDGLHYNLGMAQLNLFDGLGTALDWLASVPGKKAIVLLTTGLDTSGADHWETLLQKLHLSDVVILPVALGGELREPDKKKRDEPHEPAAEDSGLSFRQADRALEAIAQATGGRAYFPRSARDFATIYRQAASLLRHQYSLGFAPPAHDGRLHGIQVQVVDARGHVLAPGESNLAYRINSRQVYFAPGP